MRLTLRTHEIENIEKPGEISSILNFIFLDKSNEEIGELIGQIPDRTKKDTTKYNKGFKKLNYFITMQTQEQTAVQICIFTGIFSLSQLFGFLES